MTPVEKRMGVACVRGLVSFSSQPPRVGHAWHSEGGSCHAHRARSDGSAALVLSLARACIAAAAPALRMKALAGAQAPCGRVTETVGAALQGGPVGGGQRGQGDNTQDTRLTTHRLRPGNRSPPSPCPCNAAPSTLLAKHPCQGRNLEGAGAGETGWTGYVPDPGKASA